MVSSIGGFLGIFVILITSWKVLGDREAALLIVGSMGASAVLVFGVPHGPLSQPWSVFGGHAVSAIVGVACAKAVPMHPFIAAALAVGGAIGAMHYLRCIHPPGGATAISAVIGGPAVHSLGFGFLVTPVLLNVSIILVTAIAVNSWFPWRRYPAGLRGAAPADESRDARSAPGALSHSDYEYALHEIDSTVAVSEGELARIHRLASAHARSAHLEPWQIRTHHFYSNGHFGSAWSIRKIVDDHPHDDPTRDLVTWLVADGNAHPPTGTCPRSEFALWARHEVFRDLRSWSRVAR